MENMKMQQPVYHEEGSKELRKNCESFEAKIFAKVTSGKPGTVTGDSLSRFDRQKYRDFMLYMKPLYIRYGGSWNDNKQCYTGGQLKDLRAAEDVDNVIRDVRIKRRGKEG
ncbi:hypothetical protein Csa_020284 [Cucumis sativus]|nr:hypothetical protein Csa_020284 [Cucumis sativus]